jgi:hypothetical protein
MGFPVRGAIAASTLLAFSLSASSSELQRDNGAIEIAALPAQLTLPPFRRRDIIPVQTTPAADPTQERVRTPRKKPSTVRPEISPELMTMPRIGGLAATPRVLLPGNTWVYQLQGADWKQVRDCGADIAVIDYSSDGSKANAFTAEQVNAMRRKPDGKEMKIISYMSIGEAEDYRDIYWRKEWQTNRSSRPKWLGPTNDFGWSNNYKVRYWDPDWQRIIFGTPNSYMDRHRLRRRLPRHRRRLRILAGRRAVTRWRAQDRR